MKSSEETTGYSPVCLRQEPRRYLRNIKQELFVRITFNKLRCMGRKQQISAEKLQFQASGLPVLQTESRCKWTCPNNPRPGPHSWELLSLHILITTAPLRGILMGVSQAANSKDQCFCVPFWRTFKWLSKGSGFQVRSTDRDPRPGEAIGQPSGPMVRGRDSSPLCSPPSHALAASEGR
jgi:hypothetical protein